MDCLCFPVQPLLKSNRHKYKNTYKGIFTNYLFRVSTQKEESQPTVQIQTMTGSRKKDTWRSWPKNSLRELIKRQKSFLRYCKVYRIGNCNNFPFLRDIRYQITVGLKVIYYLILFINLLINPAKLQSALGFSFFLNNTLLSLA